MSCIVDFAETISQGASFLSGFDVVGLDTENIRDTAEDESMFRESFGDFGEDNYSYNFNHSYDFSEGEGEYSYSFDAGGEGVLQDTDSEVSESVDGENSEVVEEFGEDGLVVEFFDDGVESFSDFVGEEDNLVIKGISGNAEVEYDEQAGTLSVDGKELVQLDFSFDSNDNNYEIF